MSFDADKLYELLPAVYRLRDAERGEPLRALLAVIADQAVVLEDDLAQLYDDLFIETCAPWVVPYLGDLAGLRGVQGPRQSGFAPRAEVANTISYRRRKGTAAMLEQLARDVTGWPARAVEFFQLLATTQYLNHARPENRSFLNVREAGRLERLGGAFEHLPPETDLPHIADVRRIASGRGRYNIPNVGLFLWRVRACPLTRSPAAPAGSDDRCFRFDPLGRDLRLFSRPETEDEVTSLAAPHNVPEPIGRRALSSSLEVYYRADGSLLIELQDEDRVAKPEAILASQVAVCDLSGWQCALPKGKVAVDPVLGRLMFAEKPERAEVKGKMKRVLVTYHYGFTADIGGGEYGRLNSFGAGLGKPQTVANVHILPDLKPLPSVTIGDALKALPAPGGVVEILDSGRYAEALTIAAGQGRIEVRAGDKHRPLVALGAGEVVEVSGDDQGEVTLNGLLICGGPVRVTGKLGRLRLRHCTLTAPQDEYALQVTSPNTRVEIERCILVGGLQVEKDARVLIRDSILDAGVEARPAYEGVNGAPGGSLRVEGSTVTGAVHAAVLEMASNALFLSPVTVLRRQEGCVRFCYLAPGSQTPRRYHCQPESDGDAARLRPAFTSLRYGDPGYAQLSAHCPDEIRRGADDESEMGAFHHLFQPQREAYLRARLEEYLRFGLEAGLIFAS